MVICIKRERYIASKDTMVVRTRSILSSGINPSVTARKLTANRSVCIAIEIGEPTQRVTARAVFWMRCLMVRLYTSGCYNIKMKLTGGAYLTTVQRTIFTIWN